jgi:hypothetical protein
LERRRWGRVARVRWCGGCTHKGIRGRAARVKGRD